VPPTEIDIFQARMRSVAAPAGCGKTQLIADALTQHTDNKPVLVLTHTNAGVTALRARLQRGAVPSSAYRGFDWLVAIGEDLQTCGGVAWRATPFRVCLSRFQNRTSILSRAIDR
jgi:hypothetical protein